MHHVHTGGCKAGKQMCCNTGLSRLRGSGGSMAELVLCALLTWRPPATAKALCCHLEALSGATPDLSAPRHDGKLAKGAGGPPHVPHSTAHCPPARN